MWPPGPAPCYVVGCGGRCVPWTVDGAYRPRTGAEWLTYIRDRYTDQTNLLGLSAPRWLAAAFSTVVSLAVSYAMADLDEALAAIPDVRSVRSATGQALLDLADLANVTYSTGTPSTATVSVTAWSSGPVTISPSHLFRGGGTDGTAEWAPNETVTVAAGSTSDVNLVCTSVGVITAGPSTITTRVLVPAGVTAVTNAVAAVPGTEADSEDVIRVKILRGSSAAGSRSARALQDNILAVPGVLDCIVVPNDTVTSVSVSSRTVPACGLAVWVHPSTLDDATKTAVCDVIHGRKDASRGISYPTTTGSTGVRATYSDADRRTRSVGFWYVRDYAVQVKVTVTRYEAGYSLPAQVTSTVRDAVTTYFATLAVGGVLAQQDLQGYVVNVPGVGRATVEYKLQGNPGTDPDGDTWGAWTSSSDATPDAADRFVLYGTVAVT